MQHEVYPSNTSQASRQILLIQDAEIRDRLSSSDINKFLYQYSSETRPKQTYSNMVSIKYLIYTCPVYFPLLLILVNLFLFTNNEMPTS